MLGGIALCIIVALITVGGCQGLFDLPFPDALTSMRHIGWVAVVALLGACGGDSTPSPANDGGSALGGSFDGPPDAPPDAPIDVQLDAPLDAPLEGPLDGFVSDTANDGGGPIGDGAAGDGETNDLAAADGPGSDAVALDTGLQP